MKQQAILYTAYNDNILELAKYLIKRNWQIICAGNVSNILETSQIAHTKTTLFDNMPRTFLEYMSVFQSILTAGHQNEREFLDNSDTIINLVCINLEIQSNQTNYNNEFIYSNAEMRTISIVQAACRNYKKVLILTDPKDYHEAIIQIETESISEQFRLYLVAKACNMVSAYTAEISNKIANQLSIDTPFQYFTMPYKKSQEVLNSENNAESVLYTLQTGSLSSVKKIQGKEMSSSIYSDVNIVWQYLSGFYKLINNSPSVTICDKDNHKTEIKFSPATGFVFTCAAKNEITISSSLGSNATKSFKKMSACRKSFLDNAVVGFSSVVDEITAQELLNTKFAAIVAPDFTSEARTIFAPYKDIRLITISNNAIMDYNIVSLDGGIIINKSVNKTFDKWDVFTKIRPTQKQADEAAFGHFVLENAKEDCATVIQNMTTSGMCCASLAPLDACLASIQRAANNKTELLTKSNCPAEVLVSKNAIPFRIDDCKRIVDFGIKVILQPGGTDSDDEFIKFCDEHNIAMIFTNKK